MNSISPNFELSLWQKRQAALLYHYSSLDYLKALLVHIEAIIAKAEALLDEQARLDPNKGNWSMNGYLGHWCLVGMPALNAFRECTISDILQRGYENYGITGANQCGRLIDECYNSLDWIAPDKKEEFKEQLNALFSYAIKLNEVMRHQWDDRSFWIYWQKNKHLFPRLPKFKVHTKIEGETDKTPPRTGVYVPQNDPNGSLQFAWTGGEGRSKELANCRTFNDVGLDVLRFVGREGLWGDAHNLMRFAKQPQYAKLLGTFDDDAQFEIGKHAFTKSPSKWYFVELIEGEYEESDPDSGILITKASPPPEPAPAPEVRAASEPWFTALKRELAALLSSKKK